MHTMVGDVMGTPAFMAPEQASGEIDDIDPRTDIFALGAILYNILTLEAPIQGQNINEILLNACDGNIVPIDSHGRPIPDSLKAVCLKALATKQDRPLRRCQRTPEGHRGLSGRLCNQRRRRHHMEATAPLYPAQSGADGNECTGGDMRIHRSAGRRGTMEARVG